MGLSEQEIQALVKEHRETIFGYLLKRTFDRDVAEDLTQDVLVRVHRSRETYDAAKGEFGAWVMRIAHNVLITHADRGRRNPVTNSLDADVSEPASKRPSAESHFDKKVLIAEIKNAIRRLPEPERTVIFNKEIRQRKLSETATELGLSVRTVSRKLLSGYDLLRAELAGRGITPEEFTQG